MRVRCYMIDDILKKAKQGQELTDDEFLELLNITDKNDLEKLFSVACEIRDNQSKVIKLTSTVHITNKCQIQPRCEYCGFAEETSSMDFSVKSPPTFTRISKSLFPFTILHALTACFPLYPYPPEQLTRGICASCIDLTAFNISSSLL